MRTLLKGFIANGLSEPFRGAVLVENDTIIAVEKDICGTSAADRILQWKDEIIAPGFIDVHGHSDLSVLADPAGASKRHQGVTCEITGNCGLSAFPLTANNFDHLQKLYENYGVLLSWNDCRTYLDTLEQKPVNLRIFPLCGHNTLRSAAAGYEQKELKYSELEQMKKMLVCALESGAVGMSTGLLYTPGCFAGHGEIVALMQILAKYDAVYTTHLRSEGDKLLESLIDTINAAKEAHLTKIQISHLKTAGAANWHKLDAALDIIRDARAGGLDIRFDRYPYTESQTMLSVILPAPFDTMPDRDITQALLDEKAVAAVRESLSMRDDSDWQRWRITGTTHPKWKNFIGRKYSSITEDKVTAVIDQLRFDATTATIGAAGLSEENMLKIITDDLCMAGSDGNALPLSTCFGTAHPRAFGAIAEFIHLKLAHGQSIGKCIKAVSSTPAEFFRLPDIGLIQCGKKADITVFSPDDIGCKADFVTPHCFADGIKMTMLNGNAEFY